MKLDKIKECDKHGFTVFIHINSKNGGWYSCRSCRREVNKKYKAVARGRDKVVYAAYQREYHAKVIKVKRMLSVYLTMIMIAAEIG